MSELSLEEWAKKQSKSLSIEDGESVEVVYDGYKVGVNPFDADKEIVFYKVKVEIAGEEMTKVFKSGSVKAARFFHGIPVGGRVRITRNGIGTETKYEYEDLGGGKRVEDKPETEDEPF